MLLGFVDDDPVLVGEEGDKKVLIRVCNGPRHSRADVPGLAAALLLPAIYPNSQGHLRSLPDPRRPARRELFAATPYQALRRAVPSGNLAPEQEDARRGDEGRSQACLLYTSDAADE